MTTHKQAADNGQRTTRNKQQTTSLSAYKLKANDRHSSSVSERAKAQHTVGQNPTPGESASIKKAAKSNSAPLCLAVRSASVCLRVDSDAGEENQKSSDKSLSSIETT